MVRQVHILGIYKYDVENLDYERPREMGKMDSLWHRVNDRLRYCLVHRIWDLTYIIKNPIVQ